MVAADVALNVALDGGRHDLACTLETLVQLHLIHLAAKPAEILFPIGQQLGQIPGLQAFGDFARQRTAGQNQHVVENRETTPAAGSSGPFGHQARAHDLPAVLHGAVALLNLIVITALALVAGGGVGVVGPVGHAIHAGQAGIVAGVILSLPGANHRPLSH